MTKTTKLTSIFISGAGNIHRGLQLNPQHLSQPATEAAKQRSPETRHTNYCNVHCFYIYNNNMTDYLTLCEPLYTSVWLFKSTMTFCCDINNRWPQQEASIVHLFIVFILQCCISEIASWNSTKQHVKIMTLHYEHIITVMLQNLHITYE